MDNIELIIPKELSYYHEIISPVNSKMIHIIENYIDPSISDWITRGVMCRYMINELTRLQRERIISKSLIICDDTNNTTEDVDNSVLKCDIYLQPIKCVDRTIYIHYMHDKYGFHISYPQYQSDEIEIIY